jgi:hypothetical protein
LKPQMIIEIYKVEEAHFKAGPKQVETLVEVRKPRNSLPDFPSGSQTFADPQNCHTKLLATVRSRSSESAIACPPA